MDASVFLRFDELLTTARPRDVAEGLNDLDVAAGIVMPPVVDGVTGNARQFTPATGHGLQATDRVSGSTLHTRDVTVQAILQWDLAGQVAHGNPGTILARGKGTAAAEYVAYGLEIRVVNAAALIGEVRWLWHTVAGVLKTQVGGHFQASTGFVLLTATRRWVSTAEVVLRYYLADELLAEIVSGDGDIGGGTTGTMAIGSRQVGGAYARFFAGAIDELRVIDRELTAEEIKATWDRIAVHQPRARGLVLDLHPPGFPMPDNPAARVRKESAVWGDVFGYAAAQAENVRANVMPDRAYGDILARWEAITKQAPKLGDSTDIRRARVLGRLAQHAGIAIEGLDAALAPLVDTDVANLEIMAFDQTITDAFAALATQRWWAEPAADWTILSGELRAQNTAGAVDLSLSASVRNWKFCLTSMGGGGRGAKLIAKLTPTTLPANCEVGIVFGDIAAGNVFLYGLGFDGATYEVYTEPFRAWVSQGHVSRSSFGAAKPTPLWLMLSQTGSIAYGEQPTLTDMIASWSTTSGIAGFAASPNIAHPSVAHWAGLYMRSFGGTSPNADARFDDLIMRAPCGDRSFQLYAFRDPGLAGRPDLVGANNIIRGLRQAHTNAAVITNKSTLCDDASTPCDMGPMGGF